MFSLKKIKIILFYIFINDDDIFFWVFWGDEELEGV